MNSRIWLHQSIGNAKSPTHHADYDQAAAVVARALPYGDHVAALHVVAARAAEALGDHGGAEKHWVRANQIDPFDPEIHCGLARLLTRRGAPTAARETRVCQRLNQDQ